MPVQTRELTYQGYEIRCYKLGGLWYVVVKGAGKSRWSGSDFRYQRDGIRRAKAAIDKMLEANDA